MFATTFATWYFTSQTREVLLTGMVKVIQKAKDISERVKTFIPLLILMYLIQLNEQAH